MMVPEPTFVMYRMTRRFTGMRVVGVPLRADFSLDEDALLARIEREQPALVWLAYPNNPDRQPVRREQRACASSRRAPGLVVRRRGVPRVRAASVHAALPSSRTCVVMRTRVEARPGRHPARLPGRRAGLDRASSNKVRPPYNVNVLTAGGGARSCSSTLDVLDDAGRRRFVAERERLGAALAALPGVELFPSRSEFLPGARARCASARSRRCSRAGRAGQELQGCIPLLANCLRITVGTPDENAYTASRHCRKRSKPATNPHAHAPRSPATPTRRRSASRVDLDGTGAAQLATGVPFLDHMLDQVARHGMLDLDDRGQGRPAHRRAPHGRGRRHHARPGGRAGDRRQEGHPPLRPRLRAARRGAVARGDRLFRPARASSSTCRSRAALIGDVRRRPHARILPGLRQPRAVTLHIDNLRGDNAHHQCETVFKAFARALRMAVRARSARGRARFRRPRAACRPLVTVHDATIAVVDYGMGNLRSVAKALRACRARGARCVVTARPGRSSARPTRRAAGPGRDARLHAQPARSGAARGGARGRRERRPFLGVCLGLQMLFEHERGRRHAAAWALFAGQVLRFRWTGAAADGERSRCRTWAGTGAARRAPHPLWAGIADGARFYFVHSYYAAPAERALTRRRAATTARRFTCAVARDNIFATQFHPEKSAAAGLQLSRNFVALERP